MDGCRVCWAKAQSADCREAQRREKVNSDEGRQCMGPWCICLGCDGTRAAQAAPPPHPARAPPGLLLRGWTLAAPCCSLDLLGKGGEEILEHGHEDGRHQAWACMAAGAHAKLGRKIADNGLPGSMQVAPCKTYPCKPGWFAGRSCA